MNEAAHGGPAYQAEQPKDDQYYRDRVQHIFFFFYFVSGWREPASGCGDRPG
jgi:hypothetical protein